MFQLKTPTTMKYIYRLKILLFLSFFILCCNKSNENEMVNDEKMFLKIEAVTNDGEIIVSDIIFIR